MNYKIMLNYIMKLLVLLSLITFLFPKEVVAVLDLAPEGLSDSEARILTQRLTSELISIDKYTIVERASMDKLLKEQQFQHSGCTDSECAVEIGQMLNADYITVGSVSKFGEVFIIDCRLINAESGEALTSSSFTTKTNQMEELLRGIKVTSKRICGLKGEKNLNKPQKVKKIKKKKDNNKMKQFLKKLNKNRKKIFWAWFISWIGWGLLPYD